MKPIDAAKAFALAFVIMAMLMWLSYPVVSLYAFLIAPGHPPAFYAAAASNWLVPTWVRSAGPVFFFFAGWLFTGRIRHRNAYAFIAAVCGWYLLLEFVSFTILGGIKAFFTSGVAPWLALQFAAGFLGVLVARWTLPANEQPIPKGSTNVEFDLKGRTAFVTGATSGLGKHFAHLLADAGAKVAIAGRRADRLAEGKKDIEAKGGVCTSVVLDVTDASRIAPAFDDVEKALGPIDILINNAGMNIRGFVTDLAIEDFDTIMSTNLRGPFLMAREAGKRMIARKQGGRIINTGSIGTFRVLPGVAAYCISKAAIGMMTQCLAQEWARYDINVNAICPGYIETELNSGWLRSESGQARIQTFPKKKLQKETDLDGMVLLLASDAGRAITGALLPVDDGQSL